MNKSRFEEFFKTATGYDKPHQYQIDLACSDTFPTILNVPTGCGKTEAAVLSWLWRRTTQGMPRRLIYCLPMRSLVDQMADRIKDMLSKLGTYGGADQIQLVVLRGGLPDSEWRDKPENAMIIVGTQDMLLSKALNRGYASNPARWPIEFGLLNNDCLWIVDEVQLMGSGLSTTLQLQAFRESMSVYGECHTLWMSATVSRDGMKTIDYNKEHCIFPKKKPSIKGVTDAKKELEFMMEYDGKKYKEDAFDRACKNGPALVVLNTVGRAQEVYRDITKKHGNTLLIHSRFRQYERNIMNEVFNKKLPDDLVIVATQAIEAGLDISVKTLVTELAPIASMIQRFGRCNRKGKFDQDARVYWIDIANEASPYEESDMDAARSWVKTLKSASSQDINSESLHSRTRAVLRQTDILGFFDTSPDLSGNYLDVSRFVRDTQNTDVGIYWRDINTSPGNDQPKPNPDEVCKVGVNKIKDFLDEEGKAWYYDHFRREANIEPWVKVGKNDIRPGQMLLLDVQQGGYHERLGWTGDPHDKPTPSDVCHEPRTPPKYEFVTLTEHTICVCKEMGAIAKSLKMDPDMIKLLGSVALYHDVGKAHEVYQNTARSGTTPPNDKPDIIYAKWKGGRLKHNRANFRHEVGSALAYLEHANSPRKYLGAYLIAAHHGKVRVSFKRARNKGTNATQDEQPRILGYNVGRPEKLPSIKMCNFTIPPTTLDMSIAEMGRARTDKPSWLEMTLGLLHACEIGPFRLAHLEAVTRAADGRGSRI